MTKGALYRWIQARFQIRVDDLSRTPRDMRLYLADGFAGTPLRTKPVRAIAEVRFQDGFHHQLDRGLYDAVANRRNPESTTLSRFPRLGMYTRRTGIGRYRF